jgi:geranylgeranyl diphosphate synthase type II
MPGSHWLPEIERRLTALCHGFGRHDHRLEEAMAYSVLAGGKRIRPILSLLTCQTLGGTPEELLDLSLAAELLHAYSLIHDDLPAMDNDDLRRGKPTNHKVFGEATAILAGDALHSEAFEILATAGPSWVTPLQRQALITTFCQCIGRHGMVGGQAMDLFFEGRAIDLTTLQELHRRKTGALIRFSVLLSAQLADVTPDLLNALTDYSEHLGLLFQVVDDLLDITATPEELGKTPGKDEAVAKATFPRLLGEQKTMAYADHLLECCHLDLRVLAGEDSGLAEMASFVRFRHH